MKINKKIVGYAVSKPNDSNSASGNESAGNLAGDAKSTSSSKAKVFVLDRIQFILTKALIYNEYNLI